MQKTTAMNNKNIWLNQQTRSAASGFYPGLAFFRMQSDLTTGKWGQQKCR